jgi:lipopolysaccharide export system permease protein
VKHGILQRYLLRALALNWLVLFLGLMLIMLIAQVPNILGRATDHELAPHLVFEVLLLMVVANAPIVILMTMLLAIVVTTGQLSHDSEFTAMRAAGFSPLRLLAVVGVFSVPLAASLAVIAHDLAPRAYCVAVLARADAARNILSAPMRPGVFVPLGAQGTLFAGNVAPDGELRQVFVSFNHLGRPGVLTAARGRLRADTNGERFFLALFEGEYHEGYPGERRFRIVRFQEFTRPIVFPLEARACVRPDTRKTTELWGSTSGPNIAELNLRFAQVSLAILFVLVGVPLSITRPRSGAYSRVPPAMLVYALATFSIQGLSHWSARAPVLGTVILWALMTFAIVAAALWFIAIQHGSLRWRAPG